MKLTLDVSEVADMEIQNTMFWIIGRSPSGARRWYDGLMAAVGRLTEFPRRLPIARDFEDSEREVRQMMYGQYRVLYTIRDADGDGAHDTVTILHVRHGARERR